MPTDRSGPRPIEGGGLMLNDVMYVPSAQMRVEHERRRASERASARLDRGDGRAAEYADGTVDWRTALELIGARGTSRDTFKRYTTEGAVVGDERVVLATVPRPGGDRVRLTAIEAFNAAYERAAARKRGRPGQGADTNGRRLDATG